MLFNQQLIRNISLSMIKAQVECTTVAALLFSRCSVYLAFFTAFGYEMWIMCEGKTVSGGCEESATGLVGIRNFEIF